MMKRELAGYLVISSLALLGTWSLSNISGANPEQNISQPILATGHLKGNIIQLDFENLSESNKRFWNMGNSSGDKQFYVAWKNPKNEETTVSSFGNFAYGRNVPSYHDLEPQESLQFELDLLSRGWEPKIVEGAEITAVYYSPGIFADSIDAEIFLQRLRIELVNIERDEN